MPLKPPATETPEIVLLNIFMVLGVPVPAKIPIKEPPILTFTPSPMVLPVILPQSKLPVGNAINAL